MNLKNSELHNQFLQDIYDLKIYFLYVKKKVEKAKTYNELELMRYHKAYIKLSNCYEDYSGSDFKKSIKVIIESNQNAEDKYNAYKNFIKQESIKYNEINIIHKHKQIKL